MGKTKIETRLSPAEVVELLHTLIATPGGDKLRVIREEAAKRGIAISISGAAAFRDAALSPFLETLRKAKEKSKLLAEMVSDGDESGLLAAGRTKLAEQVTDFIMGDGADPEQYAALAKTLSLLSGSHQADRVTALRVRKMELELARLTKAEETAKAALGDGKLTDAEKAARLRAVFGMG